MIEEIQISPTKVRWARCKKCKKKIERLEVRGVFIDREYGGYFCSKCTKKELLKAPVHIEKMNKGVEKFEKMNDEEKLDYLNRLKILKQL